MRLARLALAATRKLPAVLSADDGPSGLYVTADPPHGVLRGVSVIAQADGRYEVDLCLNAKLVPLPQLGEAVATAVRSRVERDGLGLLLGEVHVEFADVLTDAEVAARQVRATEHAAEQAPAVEPARAAAEARAAEHAAEQARAAAETRAGEHPPEEAPAAAQAPAAEPPTKQARAAGQAAEGEAITHVTRERVGAGDVLLVVVKTPTPPPGEAVSPPPTSAHPSEPLPSGDMPAPKTLHTPEPPIDGEKRP